MTPSATVGEYTIEGCTQDEIEHLSRITSDLTDAQLSGHAPRPDQPLIPRHDLINLVKEMFVINDPTATKKIAHMYEHGVIGKARANGENGKSIIVYWMTDKGLAMMNGEAIPEATP